MLRLNHLAVTAKTGTKPKNLKKTTLAATHHLYVAKVTRELLDRHLNQKKLFGLTKGTVQL
ncbi:hypothetical protein GCM10028858_21510 [Halorubrum pallidum]